MIATKMKLMKVILIETHNMIEDWGIAEDFPRENGSVWKSLEGLCHTDTSQLGVGTALRRTASEPKMGSSLDLRGTMLRLVQTQRFVLVIVMICRRLS